MTHSIVAAKAYNADQVNFSLSSIANREEPLKVLLCTPDYFDIVDVKNAYMEGQQGNSDKQKVLHQWNILKGLYDELCVDGLLEEVLVIDGAEGCEDMVFCANQTFPWQMNGKRLVVMSKMRHPSRQREVVFFETFFTKLGYAPVHLSNADMFEGMGDTIPHPGKQLLYGGYGHRSDTLAYHELSEKLNVPVVTLELPNAHFYHLDTCFVPLSENEVMLCPDAFTPVGLEAIRKLFVKVYEIPLSEAVSTFCLNAHVMHNVSNGKKAAIIQKGSTAALAALKETGYTVYETETSEFMKSGGSVFCMKMMLY